MSGEEHHEEAAGAAVKAPAGDTAGRPSVVLTRRGARRAHGLHPWIYASDVAEVRAAGGDIVDVLGPRGRPAGWALYSDRSQIALRLLDHRGARPDRDFWRRRLQRAVAMRERLRIDDDAYRLVNAEADLLPSVIVDRYGDYLALQTLSQGADRLSELLTELLVELLSPAGIVVRNDPRVRELEGLARSVEVVHGEVPERVVVREGGVAFGVDLRGGQKTGLFLDQRENHAAAAQYAAGRLLDAFAYQGGFCLGLASRCEQVVAVEVGEEAAAALRANAASNGIVVEVRVANAFDQLRAFEAAGESFDTIVLDPPAFAKNKASVASALAGYKEINLRAMKLLRPGGHLITCSCSYHVDEAAFAQMLADAAGDVHERLAIVERRGQSRDHPVRLGVPETAYLKCFILRRIE